MNRIGKSNISEQAMVRKGERTWGKSAQGTQRRWTALSLGPTTALKHPWVRARLLGWYAAGDTEYRLPGTGMVFKVSAQTAELLRETRRTTGALVTGRRTFDLTRGWGGRHPLGVPVFVVSHTVPQEEWVYEGSPFTFVTDGIESALEQAKAIAGDKDVGVVGASLVQQCIRAGLLDEIHLDLVPVLLGDGVRLLDHLGTEPIELESTRVMEGAGVTHLTFRVVK
jgi:dihydrofolate reductase